MELLRAFISRWPHTSQLCASAAEELSVFEAEAVFLPSSPSLLLLWLLHGKKGLDRHYVFLVLK